MDDASLTADSANQSLTQWLTPRPHVPTRRTSVSFSDIVVELSADLLEPSANVNVCCNEKTTQTEDSLSNFSNDVQQQQQASPTNLKSEPAKGVRDGHVDGRVPSYLAPGPGPGPACPGLTCQELLALSGALGAALPTPLALPNNQVVSATGEQPAPAKNNINPLNSSSAILPSLAMALWPEPVPSEFFLCVSIQKMAT